MSPFRRRRFQVVGLHLRTLLPVLLVATALGGGVAACGGDADEASAWAIGTPSPTAGTATAAQVPMGDMTMPTGAEVDATWAARPAYVKELPEDWQAAYKFALARPDVLQWMPCYCGCEGMGHRSNLDCFFQRREVTGTFTYEEHGSFCDICVKTANLASQMLRDGSTATQIRAAVDAQFGNGAAPGTDTVLPPAS